MDKLTLFRWIVGIILIIGGVAGMIISIVANATTKKQITIGPKKT